MSQESYYKIAGLNLRIVGGGGIDGLSVFQIEPLTDVAIDIEIICDCSNIGCVARELNRFVVDDVSHIFLRHQSGYLFTLQRDDLSVTLRHEEGTRIVRIEHCDDVQLFRFMLWVAYSLVALRHGVVPIHSSAVIYKESGILFLGESGAGKSTQSALWLRHIDGCRLLNDDSPILRIDNNRLMVYGSPWSGKTACYINECYSVKALVRVVKSESDVIHRNDPINSLAATYPSLPPMFAFDEQLSDLMLEILSKVISCVSIYTLRCTKEMTSAQVTHLGIYGKKDNK